jgi:ribosome maturation protein Sdo1
MRFKEQKKRSQEKKGKQIHNTIHENTIPKKKKAKHPTTVIIKRT